MTNTDGAAIDTSSTAGPAPTGKGEQTRHKILIAAVDHFAQFGYRRGSVTAIARDVGLSPPAIHAHFPTKDDLFLAALEHDAAALFEIVSNRFERPPGPHRWGSMITDLVTESQTRPLIQRVLQNQEPGMISRLISMPSVSALSDRILGAIRQGQEAGVIRSETPATLLATGFETILFSLVLAAVQTELTSADPERFAGVAALLTTGLLDPALSPTPAPESRQSKPTPPTKGV